jgi:hypothetical protein
VLEVAAARHDHRDARRVRDRDDFRVTLGYVWTRPDNEAAVRLYRSAGFEPNRQLVLTWYPMDTARQG